MQSFRTADGRVLEYLDVGDPDGRPVGFLHGTPGTAGTAALFEDAARHHHVRLFALSRPGYGATSMTAPGLASVGEDLGELATGLGIGEFDVLGVSGGGPFALAAGSTLTTRVRHVAVAAGPAPYFVMAPEVLESEDLEALELLAKGDADGAVATLTAAVRRTFDAMCQLPADEFEAAFNEMSPSLLRDASG
jgi:pimeloyl-ACP methyl ester carboxylesterase